MIDRKARNSLAEAIRSFAAGRIDNFEFQDKAESISTTDPGVIAVKQQIWYFYDDVFRHRLKRKWSLSKQQHEIVARSVLFLKSNSKYQWPSDRAWNNFVVLLLLGVPTLGFLPRLLQAKWQENGDWEVWPFLTIRDLEEAKSRPAYLAKST